MTELNKIHKEYCTRIVNNIAAFVQGLHQAHDNMLNFLRNVEDFSNAVYTGSKS